MEIDLSKAIDNYCPICKTKKIKYIGKLMGNDCVFYKPDCNCEKPIEYQKLSKSDKELFDSLQVPFWKLMGLPPKEKDIQYEKFLKHRGMTYGDAVRERDYYRARNESALKEFEKSR
jgi:hypothetical protein